jgi:hypothetical protein
MKEYITIFGKGARRVLNHKVTIDGKESEPFTQAKESRRSNLPQGRQRREVFQDAAGRLLPPGAG